MKIFITENQYKDIKNFVLMNEETSKCPPATQDIDLNLENRQEGIEHKGYGPLNPMAGVVPLSAPTQRPDECW